MWYIVLHSSVKKERVKLFFKLSFLLLWSHYIYDYKILFIDELVRRNEEQHNEVLHVGNETLDNLYLFIIIIYENETTITKFNIQITT